MEFSTRLSIKQSFHLNFEERPSYLRSSHEPLAEISGMMSFYGHETIGSVVVSGSREIMSACCEHMLPSNPNEAAAQAQDVAGDMCNAIVGRLKGFLSKTAHAFRTHGPSQRLGTPTSLAFGTGRLSFGSGFVERKRHSLLNSIWTHLMRWQCVETCVQEV